MKRFKDINFITCEYISNEKKINRKALLVSLTACVFACNNKEEAPSVNDGGLILPAGFSSTIVADSLGRARHLVVTPQNDIYVRLSQPKDGKGTFMLHEQNGKATAVDGFGNSGGTGVYLAKDYLYTASDSEIFRYKLDADNHVIDTAHPERIVTGLVDGGEHNTKSIMMDGHNNLYIPIGCPSNSCQEHDRQTGSMGIPGCPLLKTAGGVWMFKSDKKDQTYADGVRYSTGLRNVVGVAWNYQSNKLFVMQHGRDQLNTIFPALYTAKQNAQLPAECMYALTKGADAGWPYIYYDPFKKEKILMPEYGGDGKKTNMLTAPSGATHFRIHSAGTEIDFENNNYVVETGVTADLPWDNVLTTALTFTHNLTANSIHPLFILLGLDFLQEVNGSMYPLKNGAFNALAIVNVS